MLVPMSVILNKVREEGYGIVAPNVYSADTIEGAFQSAHELKSPLIMDCYEVLDLEMAAYMAQFYSKRYPNVTTALNLDHGKSFDSAVRAIKYGFTSVMVDRSQLPFEENVRQTSEIVKMAHAVGLSVEAELGCVGQGESYDKDRDAGLTKVEEALEFVRKTEVDCLAIAIGTAHGRYIGMPKLDFERLESLREAVPVPLVLHGGSSTGDENLKKAVQNGITKVNIGTDLRTNGGILVKEYVSKAEYPNLVEVYAEGVKGYKEMLKHYMRLFGSVNRE
jgi:fructose-bisphosphate aldolase, class II